MTKLISKNFGRAFFVVILKFISFRKFSDEVRNEVLRICSRKSQHALMNKLVKSAQYEYNFFFISPKKLRVRV